MISDQELRRLLSWSSNGNHILSIYLNINHSWNEMFRERYESEFRSMIQSLRNQIEPAKCEEFDQYAKAAAKLVSCCNGKAESYVFFIGEDHQLPRMNILNFPLKSQIHWARKPYALPLLEAMDECERYGVVMLDKRRARIFTFRLGEIEEEHDEFESRDIQRIKTTGRDNICSQKKLVRTNKLHVHWHLQRAADELVKFNKKNKFDRVILCGSKESIDPFFHLLIPELKNKVVEKLSLPFYLTEKEVKRKLLEVEQQIERLKETELVRKLIHSGFHTHQVSGLAAVLDFLNRNQIHQLIYSETFPFSGSHCTGCNYFYPMHRLLCGRCNSLIKPLPVFLQEVAEAVLKQGGSIEEIRGEAALQLNQIGGIGAIVKGYNSVAHNL